MKSIRKNKAFLEFLINSTKEQRNTILKSVTDQNIKALCEIALNTLSGNIQLSKSKKSRLQKFKSTLRSLTKKSLSLSKKGS